MQTLESEIVVPLTNQSTKKSLILPSIQFVSFLSMFLFLLIQRFRIIAEYSQSPEMQKMFQRGIVSGVIGFIILSFFYALLLTFLIRKLRAPAPCLRISNKGISFPIPPLLIRWEEMKELTFSAKKDYFGVVPWNIESVGLRAKSSSSLFFRLIITFQISLFRRGKLSTPFAISRFVLSIPLEELMIRVREDFATELRDHAIIIREESF